MKVTLSLLCDKFLCCSRALSPTAMSQTARRVTHPAWTAEVPACGTAQCAPHSRSCLMMAAVWPAVEMRHATMINRYQGSVVTARHHWVSKNRLFIHCIFHLVKLISCSEHTVLRLLSVLENSVCVCVSQNSHPLKTSFICNGCPVLFLLFMASPPCRHGVHLPVKQGFPVF